MLKQRINVWIEKDGKVVLSLWRVRLLEAVQETGSISAAASQMGISYRRAWDKVHECEQRLGAKLLDTQTGGPGGGGAQLTREGTEYVRRFQQFSSGLDELIRNRFREVFEGTDLEHRH